MSTPATEPPAPPAPKEEEARSTNTWLVLSYATIVGLWIGCQYVLVPYVVNLLLLVTAILYTACHWSLVLLLKDDDGEDGEGDEGEDADATKKNSGGNKIQGETLSKEDAMSFPIVGSCSLFGLYLCFKLLDPKWVNLLIGVYFCLMGCVALVATMAPAIETAVKTVAGKNAALLDMSWKLQYTKDFKGLEFLKPIFGSGGSKKEEEEEKKDGAKEDDKKDDDAKKEEEKKKEEKTETEDEEEENLIEIDWEFTGVDLVALVPAVLLCVRYFQTKHWTLNNVLGICFCIQGIERFSLGTYKIGAILLIGLFFYDIFWVFGTDVMVTVAKSLDGPIKILFPRSLIPNEETGKIELSLLGLGDIVIPGFFLALLLRFDAHKAGVASAAKEISKLVHSSFPKPYFHSCLFGYVLGMGTTMFVMIRFEAAQPALLYLVPACLGSSFLCAIINGEWKELLAYSEEEEEETTETETPTKEEAAAKKDN